MRSLILTFSGPIGSGKSSLSKRVAKSLGWKYVSFGDYVRVVACQRGMGNSREALQNLGTSLIEELGRNNFCRSVLAQVNWTTGEDLVLDGIRHVEILDSLREVTKPSEVSLVFIKVEESDIKARASGKHPVQDRSRVGRHSTEEQVHSTLSDLADLNVDGRKPVEDLVREAVMWVRNRRSAR